MEAARTILLLLSFLSCTLAIPRENFYSFGPDVGDTALPPNDDESSGLITLLFGSFPYFDEQHTNLYVNTNGDISFAGPVSTFTPRSFPLSGFSLIAPYWADVDTRGTGTVYYRETRDNDVRNRARDDIRTAFSKNFQPIFVFIATWDRVGHFSQQIDRIATFQCVLMTDGTISFVKFLYADGEIQWTTGGASGGINGFGGTPAQVGFDAGDGERFFSVPGSQTNEIVNITSTTNVDVPGVWTFQVNGNISQCSDLEDMENTPLVITPRVGNMLGGTAVSISGMCLEESDTILCQYEGFNEMAADVAMGPLDLNGNSTLAVVCVSPAFLAPGLKNLRVIVTSVNETLKYDSDTQFYAVHLEDSAEVRHDLDDLLIRPGTEISLTWNRFDVVPNHVEDPTSYMVNIVLVQFKSSATTEDLDTLAYNIPNSGQANIISPFLTNNVELAEDVLPVAIQVRISGELNADNGRRKRNDRISIVGQLVHRVILWSSVLYYHSSMNGFRSDVIFRDRCEAWCNEQPADIGERLLEELPPCPPRVIQARFPNSGLVEDSGIGRILSNTFFHEGSNTCFRSREASISDAGQQCCYDSNGNLLVDAPGGGSVDRVAPIGFRNTLRHFQEDVIPALYCCFGGLSNCNAYYAKRPSDNGARYNPPNPACIYGDPHIVTLDGFKYTFNGRGEYLLAQVDDIFSFQGRMTQAVNPQGNPVGATVFSAVAMREGSNTIQFQVGFAGDPDTLINGAFIDFTEVFSQELNGVVVRKEENKLSASFDSGACIEVREENGFLSTLLVSFPTSWQGRTQGLMGNYNEDTADDLTPRTGNPLPLDAGLRTIHEMFGVTWIIDMPQDSIFTYPEGESWANYSFPDFEPTFEVIFSNLSLEQAAEELCGDDLFCRFDIATTENTMVGLSTLNGGQEFERIVNNSQPTVCDPSCLNGACVTTDVCSCSVGYTGVRCDTSLLMECDISPCENNGSCAILAGSYICTCPFNYNGLSCQNPVLASGSGSGSGELACKCNRSVKCSIKGKLIGQSEANVTGMELKCTIMFSNEEIDTGSGSSFVIDESFSTTEYLSSGSLCFLDNLGVVERNFIDCAVPNGLPVQRIWKNSSRPLTFTYIREDGSFGSGNVTSDNMNQQFAFGVGFDLETPYDIHVDSRGLDSENQCSLENLLQWLSKQPPPLYTAECREGLDGESTDYFFIVECPNMGG